jgi:hypothetical protein
MAETDLVLERTLNAPIDLVWEYQPGAYEALVRAQAV